MNTSGKYNLRIAILDLYEGCANQGMRCIREILNTYAGIHNINLILDEYEVRLKNEIPDISYDAYISSGGPGSPLASEGSLWEKKYFHWIKEIEKYNQDPNNILKKHIFFICHSYQLACRYYKIGNVCKRNSTAFGVFPVHMLECGFDDPVFAEMKDPFYAVDSRDYQVIKPDYQVLQQMGGSVLAIEKERPHVPYERAIMGIRFNEYFFGTQFHPEADAEGMSMYLQTEEKKKTVIENHGEEKWKSMVEQLSDPDKIRYTYNHILPNFLQIAARQRQSA